MHEARRSAVALAQKQQLDNLFRILRHWPLDDLFDDTLRETPGNDPDDLHFSPITSDTGDVDSVLHGAQHVLFHKASSNVDVTVEISGHRESRKILKSRKSGHRESRIILKTRTSGHQSGKNNKEGPGEQFNVLLGPLHPFATAFSPFPLPTLSHRIKPSRGEGHQTSHLLG